MQNDKIKCGLTESKRGEYADSSHSGAYVWYEKNWRHDDYEHVHQRGQLSFVAEGYQYFYIENRIYLVPQNHVIWIPSNIRHRSHSEAENIDLMVVLYKDVPELEFFKSIHVFAVPSVLREMLWYASKWSQNLEENREQFYFLQAILNSLPNFCSENHNLQIPVPSNEKLIPICEEINNNFKYAIDIENLARKAFMSARNLQRIFKAETGITVQKYHQLIRILKSIEIIEQKKYTLTEIAYKVGYKSLSAFTSSYQSIMKTGPSDVKKTMLAKSSFANSIDEASDF
ncbi:AraC family transcriptional regulator [Sphingobacterium sp. UGAL515B_05]|uniref:helix-turn-helix domain-containing protein n=1 Tax=Sphingobacterium sp. UGAL515B_05 TaxID=2986767 RepID=UPI0029543D6A|nr:AraC family transcriptional regulator [Sphingobacterium sp. UGAL515B_05]WON93735.1 AraC family transcriptional regulator [Sphingobacterium sp. UGAL515B_05]